MGFPSLAFRPRERCSPCKHGRVGKTAGRSLQRARVCRASPVLEGGMASSEIPCPVMLLLVVVVLASARVQHITGQARRTKYKSRNSLRTEMGLVQETQARWKDRPNVPGAFFLKAIFQVWRGQIPEKSSKNSPFPLGDEGL